MYPLQDQDEEGKEDGVGTERCHKCIEVITDMGKEFMRLNKNVQITYL